MHRWIQEILRVECTICRSILWVDAKSKIIIKHEKNKTKKTHSIEELLQKEMSRVEGFDRKF
ncbi:MAG: hypothetical protein AB1410_03770 [Acidobacteriota bacterium]